MEKKHRRKFSADFKAKVVLEALKERSTIEELAKKVRSSSEPDPHIEERVFKQCSICLLIRGETDGG